MSNKRGKKNVKNTGFSGSHAWGRLRFLLRRRRTPYRQDTASRGTRPWPDIRATPRAADPSHRDKAALLATDASSGWRHLLPAQCNSTQRRVFWLVDTCSKRSAFHNLIPPQKRLKMRPRRCSLTAKRRFLTAAKISSLLLLFQEPFSELPAPGNLPCHRCFLTAKNLLFFSASASRSRSSQQSPSLPAATAFHNLIPPQERLKMRLRRCSLTAKRRFLTAVGISSFSSSLLPGAVLGVPGPGNLPRHRCSLTAVRIFSLFFARGSQVQLLTPCAHAPRNCAGPDPRSDSAPKMLEKSSAALLSHCQTSLSDV